MEQEKVKKINTIKHDDNDYKAALNGKVHFISI